MPDVALTLSRCTAAQRATIADLETIRHGDGEPYRILDADLLPNGSARVRFGAAHYEITSDGRDRLIGGSMVAGAGGTAKYVTYHRHEGAITRCTICGEPVPPGDFVVGIPGHKRMAHTSCVAALTWPRVLAIARARKAAKQAAKTREVRKAAKQAAKTREVRSKAAEAEGDG